MIICGNENVLGAATLNTTLDVVGATTLNTTLNVGGETLLDTTLIVLGATSLQNTLDVAGATTILGAATLENTLNVVGVTTLNTTLNVGGETTLGGATTLDTTLNVLGATTLRGPTTSTVVPGFIGDGSQLTNLPPSKIPLWRTFTNTRLDYGVGTNAVDPEADPTAYVSTQVKFSGNNAQPGVYLCVTHLTNLYFTYLEVSSSITVTWDGTNVRGFSNYQRFQAPFPDTEIVSWLSPIYQEIIFNTSSIPSTDTGQFWVTYNSTFPIPGTIVPEVQFLNIDVYFLGAFPS